MNNKNYKRPELLSPAGDFEKLPLIDNVEILRNILYSGIWTKYDFVKAKRSKK